jgi:hypothetical protein
LSAHAAADEDRTLVEDIELAGELVPPVHIHHVLGVAARQLLHHTEGNEPLDLIRAQLWERFSFRCVGAGRIQRLAGRKPARLRLVAHEGQHIHVTGSPTGETGAPHVELLTACPEMCTVCTSRPPPD